jgi:hypothetical protein
VVGTFTAPATIVAAAAMIMVTLFMVASRIAGRELQRIQEHLIPQVTFVLIRLHSQEKMTLNPLIEFFGDVGG